jgi:hypothetical protein
MNPRDLTPSFIETISKVGVENSPYDISPNKMYSPLLSRDNLLAYATGTVGYTSAPCFFRSITLFVYVLLYDKEIATKGGRLAYYR